MTIRILKRSFKVLAGNLGVAISNIKLVFRYYVRRDMLKFPIKEYFVGNFYANSIFKWLFPIL